MSKHYVFYGKITEQKEIGICVNFPFYGGEAISEDEASRVAKSLINSCDTPVLVEIFKTKPGETIRDAMNAANRKFERMANEIYECESIINRRR